jgi:methyltransferase
MALLIPANSPIIWPAFAACLALQPVRYWVLWALGPRWTTRVITLPGAPLVTTGPYRYLRHPNYAVVALEIILVPLCFGAWQIAVVFGSINAVILAIRIRTEQTALAPGAIEIDGRDTISSRCSLPNQTRRT